MMCGLCTQPDWQEAERLRRCNLAAAVALDAFPIVADCSVCGEFEMTLHLEWCSCGRTCTVAEWSGAGGTSGWVVAQYIPSARNPDPGLAGPHWWGFAFIAVDDL